MGTLGAGESRCVTSVLVKWADFLLPGLLQGYRRPGSCRYTVLLARPFGCSRRPRGGEDGTGIPAHHRQGRFRGLPFFEKGCALCSPEGYRRGCKRGKSNRPRPLLREMGPHTPPHIGTIKMDVKNPGHFDRDFWCARQESNLRPLESESNALSS